LILAENATNATEAEAATSHIGIYIPQETISFYDGMVIPSNARNVDLAHKFIDFFLDPEVAYENSGIVGYTTTLKATYQMIYTAVKGDLVRQSMVMNNPYDPSTIENFFSSPLVAFSNTETYNIKSMINNVKTSN
jgi:spermidine/putrescine-binding protein